MEHQVEVLQASSLEDYDWPERDPHSLPQRTRARSAADLALLMKCLRSAELNLEAFLKDARKKGLGEEDIVLALLSHQKFQMNPVTQVRQEPAWRERVHRALKENEP